MIIPKESENLTDDQKVRQAYLYAMLTVLLWSTVACAFKLTLRFATPLHIVCLSVISSFLILLFLVLIKKEFKKLVELIKKKYLKMILMGLINPLLYYVVLFGAYDRLTAQVAQGLNYTWAIVLTLFSVFLLKEKISLKKWFGIFLAFVGVILLISKGEFTKLNYDLFGIILAMLSTVIWSTYWILNKKEESEPLLTLTANFFFAFIISIAILLIKSGPIIANWQSLLGSAYIGLAEMGLGFFFWSLALKKTLKVSKIAPLCYLSPFISLVWINYILIEEPIHIYGIIGLILVVIGILIPDRKGINNE